MQKIRAKVKINNIALQIIGCKNLLVFNNFTYKLLPALAWVMASDHLGPGNCECCPYMAKELCKYDDDKDLELRRLSWIYKHAGPHLRRQEEEGSGEKNNEMMEAQTEGKH